MQKPMLRNQPQVVYSNSYAPNNNNITIQDASFYSNPNLNQNDQISTTSNGIMNYLFLLGRMHQNCSQPIRQTTKLDQILATGQSFSTVCSNSYFFMRDFGRKIRTGLESYDRSKSSLHKNEFDVSCLMFLEKLNKYAFDLSIFILKNETSDFRRSGKDQKLIGPEGKEIYRQKLSHYVSQFPKNFIIRKFSIDELIAICLLYNITPENLKTYFF